MNNLYKEFLITLERSIFNSWRSVINTDELTNSIKRIMFARGSSTNDPLEFGVYLYLEKDGNGGWLESLASIPVKELTDSGDLTLKAKAQNVSIEMLEDLKKKVQRAER